MNPEKAELVTGINCTPETAFEEMLMVKTAYNKTGGRQFIHFVQSFHPEEKVTPEQVHEIGARLAKEFERFSGFQMVVSTHLDQDHLHNHFVMNTVNMEHGLKWQQSPAQMQMAKDFSDQLCREYGLSVIEHKGKNRESSGEYRAKQKGRSWKHELRLAVDACMKNSVNREDFIANMKKLGYETKWTDTRKDITFLRPSGKPCRLDNLNKEWTKEVLEETLKFNQELKAPEDMAGEIKKLELAIQIAKAGAETQKAEQQADEKQGTETKESRKSWENKLRQAIDACMENSVGRADFIVNMSKLGYEVNWTDTRKDITFISSDGRRRRNKTLDEHLTKEMLEEKFNSNRENKDREFMAVEIRNMELSMGRQEELNSADHGQEEQPIEESPYEPEPREEGIGPGRPNYRDNQDSGRELKYYVEWNDRYKEAQNYLYGKDGKNGEGEIKQDFHKAHQRFTEEARAGNALAMHDLGRMYADGLGIDMNAERSQRWYSKAFRAFEFNATENILRDIGDRRKEAYMAYIRTYSEYRLGKMLAAGLGVTQNYEEAADWFKKAVRENHKYAQYSLAGLYYHGLGVEQSFSEALALYKKSSEQGNAYASYEVAKMLSNGVGTEIDVPEAEEYFRSAFTGFSDLEAKSHDDKLQYRLGQMLYTGTGIDKDVIKAVGYLESSAKLGNVYAQYLLAKIYLEADSSQENVEEALEWMEKAADNGNAQAQYALGKLYRDGNHVEENNVKAVTYFKLSAEQGNQYAQYTLGKLYLEGEVVPKDVEAGVNLLKASVEQGNQFAQYTLGKLYLEGEVIPRDVAAGVELLKASVEQGNQFAQYTLGKLYLEGEVVPRDVEAGLGLFKSSVEQGNQFAQYTLGKLYLEGEVIPRDVAAGVELLKASVEQGNQFAQYTLGKLYLEGEVVPRDVEAGVELLKASVEQGNQFAQYALGKLYLEGEVVPRDVEAGLGLFKSSVEQGNQFAQYTLGKLYLEGEVVPKDVEAGVSLLKASIVQGNQFAQYTLGKLYLEGEVVPQDVGAGLELLKASVEQGNQFAQYTLGVAIRISGP
ncbi:relaxase/mobilization nuclease domain-containing protein [Desulfitobacterium hafniense]|uniref:relaxase/mobilization nuclease domain-containing protein n=1 Tax=Desulfitobacterium hafniense TaxID=49338 RepID=UPI003CFC3890